MWRIGLFVITFFIFNTGSNANDQIDHWESFVNAEDTWKYIIGTGEPLSTWIDLGFNDDLWSQGPGGIGYGDNDDGTVVPSASSVYLRIKFTIHDLKEIDEVVLLADYDDAFVAYINGKEIARSGISGNHPSYNKYADTQHEADVYQGQYPTEVLFDSSKVIENFMDGDNILAIQVHNINATSSDLSSNFYLIAGLNISDLKYQQVPNWFREPINFNFSNLPIIKIDTDGKGIPDEPKILASMGIIDNGNGIINHVDDPFTDYHGPIGIELRGSSSQSFPKKQYAVDLWTEDRQGTSASVLGLPEEEDWILYAPYSDKSLIRNFLAYNLGEALGWYAPRTKLVELYLNERYDGVYMLTEKIKRDKNRVDISKLGPDENSGDDLTGGYILKIDKTTGASNGDGWYSPYPSEGKTNGVILFQYHYPKEDEITSAQKNYIQQYITDFEDALRGPRYLDTREGYRNYINVESFIDFSIINELSKNVDGYRLSTFMYKDKDSNGGKIHLGPIWDFNLAFGNADYCSGGETTGWEWDFNEICGGKKISNPFWWKRLLRDPEYVIQLKSRWTELRQDILSNENIMNFIDSTVTILNTPQQRNFDRWPILGEYVWPNNFVGGTFDNEIGYLKTWITNRLSWLDANFASLEVVTGIEDNLISSNQISIFPNPNNGHFTIKVKSPGHQNLHLILQDHLGKTLLVKQLKISDMGNTSYSINRNLNKGLYILEIFNKQGYSYTKKIVIN